MESVLEDPVCVEALVPHIPNTPILLRNVAQWYAITNCLNLLSHVSHLPYLCGYFFTASIHLRSPQWHQSISLLVSALRCKNSDAAMAIFGLDPVAGAEKLELGDGTLTSLC